MRMDSNTVNDALYEAMKPVLDAYKTLYAQITEMMPFIRRERDPWYKRWMQAPICWLVRHPMKLYSPSLLQLYGWRCPYCGKQYR